MQTYSRLKPATTDCRYTDATHTSPLKNSTSVVLVATLAAGVAIEVVKLFGLSHGMTEQMRMTLSWIGLSICFVSAPTFLIFGRNLSVKVGFAFVASLIFVVSAIASMIA